MIRGATVPSAWIVGVALAFVAAPVDAQEIRRYGDQGEDSSEGGGGGGGGQQRRTVYPGQPMPQSNQQSGQGSQQTRQQTRQRSSSGKKEEGEQITESYAIRIHEPGDLPQKQRKKTKRPLNKPPEKMYQGVIPGERDSVEHLKREQESGQSRSSPNKVTWIGFQPKDDRTRVFVQTAREPQYSTSREEHGTVIVVRLRNTEISTRNFRRHIDTSRFDRIVKRIEASEERDGTALIRVTLRSSEAPSIERSKTYLYLDFPHQSADEDASDQGEE